MPLNLGSSYSEYDIRFDSAFEWVVAIDAYDHNCPIALGKLIEEKVIPKELRPIIAKIVTGERKPNKKSASKLKLPAPERLQIAGAISNILGIIDDFKFGDNFYTGLDDNGNELPRSKMIDIAADHRGVEPIQIIRLLDQKKTYVVDLAAEKLGLSKETIENVLRDLRVKLKNYPRV